MSARARAKDVLRRLPHPVKKQARKIAQWRRGRRILAPVRWGSLKRTRPFSAKWGTDRGTAVDRVYLNRFFERHAENMQGVVLEVQGPIFSGLYGANITKTEIVDIEPRNMLATIIVDLNDIDALPTDTFDCAVIPQTIQYLTDPLTGLRNFYASLRSGGVLLVTVPFIQKIDHEAPDADRVRFSPLGFRDLLEASCEGADIEVEGFGNVLTSVAFLMGISAEEMQPQDFDVYDPAYPMLVGARVRRPS